MTLGRRWANLSLGRKGLAVVALPTVALLVMTVTFLWVEQQEDRTQERLMQTFQVRDEIQQTFRLLINAETAARGFLLTREESFLDPYDDALEELPRTLENLSRLVVDSPDQVARLERVSELSAQQIEVIGSLIDSTELSRAQRREVLVESKSLQDQLRAELDDMRENQSRLLERRTEDLESAQDIGLVAVGGSLILGLLGGLLAMLFFISGVVRRVHRLQENAGRIDERRPLVQMPPGDDEIGQLGRQLEATGRLLELRQGEVRETRRFLEQLIERSPVVIFRRRPEDLATTFVSSNVERLLGFSPEELTGEADLWLERLHPDDAQALLDQTRDGLAREATQLRRPRTRFRRKDGEWVWLETVVQIEYDNGKPTEITGYAIDVTARQSTEMELAEREKTLGAILETSPDVIVITDERGSRRYVSPSLTETLGFSSEEALGGGPEAVHPKDRRLAVEQLRRAAAGEPARARYRMRHRDGHWVWLDVRARRLEAGHGPRTEDGSARAEVILSVREVTAQVELEKELRRAKEEAEGSSRAKSEFLSRMSHELRTPLNAILGFAQLLQMEELAPHSKEGIDEILKGGRHLLDLINEVLDIARIETGKLGLSLEPVLVGDVVDESLALVRPLAAQRGIVLSGPDGLDREWHVMADRQRLKQVLLNLLSNAVKYNRMNGRVELTCEASSAGHARIRVADTGPGIPDESRDQLFSPFERLGAEHTGVEGTGLGLALSKILVEAMGGAIEVETAPGRGTRFTVTLLMVEGPAALASVDDKPIEANGSQRGARTLLYIEDNLSNLRLVEYILARRPELKVHAAMQGRLGLDLIREHHPDLVLLDLNLPDIQGAEVLGLMRDDVATRDIPVVVISADATKHQIDRLLESGASAYLTKPLDVQRFLDVIDEFLDNGATSDSPPPEGQGRRQREHQGGER